MTEKKYIHAGSGTRIKTVINQLQNLKYLSSRKSLGEYNETGSLCEALSCRKLILESVAFLLTLAYRIITV